MFSQAYALTEPSTGAVYEAFDIATDPFMTAIYADPVTMHMGDLAYQYLTYGTQGDPVPQFSDWLGHPSTIDNIWSMGNPPLAYVVEQSIPDLVIPSTSSSLSYLPRSPSPSSSQASTLEYQQPESPSHKPSCSQTKPSKNAQGKWTCDACGTTFRGHYECNRHIKNAGKRAICLACNSNINARDDSLQRHYYKHCKRTGLGRDSGNHLRFEDAFVHL